MATVSFSREAVSVDEITIEVDPEKFLAETGIALADANNDQLDDYVTAHDDEWQHVSCESFDEVRDHYALDGEPVPVVE